MKIYLDADDTLNDFRAYAVQRGVPPWSGSWYTTDPSTWTQEQHDTQAKTNALMTRDDFWLNIPLRPGAFELVSAAASRGDVYILTALPSSVDHAYYERIRQQKFDWAWSVLHFPASRVIVCARRDKVKYAALRLHDDGAERAYPNILIDDAEQNCSEWTAAGGIAIHFDGSPSALQTLKSY